VVELDREPFGPEHAQRLALAGLGLRGHPLARQSQAGVQRLEPIQVAGLVDAQREVPQPRRLRQRQRERPQVELLGPPEPQTTIVALDLDKAQCVHIERVGRAEIGHPKLGVADPEDHRQEPRENDSGGS